MFQFSFIEVYHIFAQIFVVCCRFVVCGKGLRFLPLLDLIHEIYIPMVDFNKNKLVDQEDENDDQS